MGVRVDVGFNDMVLRLGAREVGRLIRPQEISPSEWEDLWVGFSRPRLAGSLPMKKAPPNKKGSK